MEEKRTAWDWEIKSKSSWLGTSFRELYSYKDLLFRLVRKEFLLRYQQTILGPIWILINPILTVFTYVIVFKKVIGVSTGTIPPALFYITGITLWNLFADIFSGTAGTFLQNVNVFSKVYFPRIIAPLSMLLLHCLRFLIQLILVFILIGYYALAGKVEVSFLNFLYCIPSVIIVTGIAFGAGLIFSIITAKYRDLANLLGLFIGLLMFVSPVFYSLAIVPENIHWLVQINPLVSSFELFRLAFVGQGQIDTQHLTYSVVFTIVLLYGGVLLFNKKGDALMDVV